MRIEVTNRDGDVKEYRQSSLPALYQQLCSDMTIEATCGGCASCGTCHVYLPESFSKLLNSAGDDEQAAIDGLLHQRPGSRLLCQLTETSEIEYLQITIAPQE